MYECPQLHFVFKGAVRESNEGQQQITPQLKNTCPMSGIVKKMKNKRNSGNALITLLLTRLCLRATCSSHGLAATNSIHDLGTLILGNMFLQFDSYECMPIGSTGQKC